MENEELVSLEEARWIEATHWHEELQKQHETELTQASIHVWREWIADSENRRVFTELMEVLSDSRLLSAEHLPGIDGVRNATGDATPLTSSKTTTLVWSNAARHKKFSRAAKLSLLVSATAAVFFGALFTFNGLTLTSVEKADQTLYRALAQETGQGETRTLSLPDGSVMTLGARSAVATHFDGERRSVRLDRGTAWFRVAHDKSRPFVVYAGKGTITAVGTAFVVQRDNDHVVVTVTDGAVRVAPPVLTTTILSLLPRAAARVARGEKISYLNSGSATPIEHVDVDAATGWIRGRMEFDHTRLSEVVAEVNRYSSRNISLDPALDEQKFTGLVLADEIDNWICGLESLYPVSIVERGAQILILPRPSGVSSPPSSCTPFH